MMKGYKRVQKTVCLFLPTEKIMTQQQETIALLLRSFESKCPRLIEGKEGESVEQNSIYETLAHRLHMSAKFYLVLGVIVHQRDREDCG